MVTFLFKWCAVLAMASSVNGFRTLRPLPEQFHPFHVSTTEINQNLADKTLEISCHIFTDDFETAISKEFGGKTDFSKESMKPLMDSLTRKYILNHLSLKVNNRGAALNYVGWERENEAVYVYLQVDGVSAVTQVEVVNTILYNLFDDQMNIVHVKVNGERKSHKMNYPEKNLSVKF
ncbi:MAG: hypothetical protein EOO05_07610 [Chitinophagaceae bacterium]|nr:MAG: hypothetical protein EOO05_07610 [Chitinophagaceae bacterium]